jgi:hypothetical protein
VTVREVGEIAKNLNCTDAICLDSGASSSLYYLGSYLTRPARQLSNALVITRLKTPPVRLMVNGQELFSDSDPVIRDGRTLVPMRIIFEAMGVTPAFNAHNMSITASNDDTSLELTINSNVAVSMVMLQSWRYRPCLLTTAPMYRCACNGGLRRPSILGLRT